MTVHLYEWVTLLHPLLNFYKHKLIVYSITVLSVHRTHTVESESVCGIETHLRSHDSEAICELLCSRSTSAPFQDRWPSYVATVSTWLLMPTEFIWCHMTAAAIRNNECSDDIRFASFKTGNAFLWSVGATCSSVKKMWFKFTMKLTLKSKSFWGEGGDSIWAYHSDDWHRPWSQAPPHLPYHIAWISHNSMLQLDDWQQACCQTHTQWLLETREEIDGWLQVINEWGGEIFLERLG